MRVVKIARAMFCWGSRVDRSRGTWKEVVRGRGLDRRPGVRESRSSCHMVKGLAGFVRVLQCLRDERLWLELLGGQRDLANRIVGNQLIDQS